jgi:hypothetical protein
MRLLGVLVECWHCWCWLDWRSGLAAA